MNIPSQYGCGNKGKVIDSVFIENTDKDLSINDIKNIIQKSIDNKQDTETNQSIKHLYFIF